MSNEKKKVIVDLPRKIIQEITKQFDDAVAVLGPDQYREVLEEVISVMQCRIDCLNEEEGGGNAS